MSSWKTSDLKDLKEITNHKVVWDGYEFIWMSKINNVWSRHYVRNFKDYNTPISWMYFNISKCENEYDKRQKKYVKDMRKELEIEIKITEISRDTIKRNTNKVLEILQLKPSLNNQEIADILGVNIRTIRRIRNK